MQETKRNGYWDISRVNTELKTLFIAVSNSPWMHRHFMGTAARTEILQQSGKDLAYKGKEHALDVPRHTRSRPYAAATTTLIYTMPIHPSFIWGSTSPVIKLAPPRLSNQISNSIFYFTQPESKNSEQTLCISFHRIPKTARSVILKRQPNLCMQGSQFNTKHFYSSADSTESYWSWFNLCWHGCTTQLEVTPYGKLTAACTQV